MIYGELPTSPVVFAACDSDYFMDHAGPFINSATQNGFDVHVHVVNPTDQVLSYGAILSSLTDKRVTYTFHDMDFSEWDAPASPVTNRPEIRAYYASMRFLLAGDLVKVAGKMLILDIDCLIMKPFEFPTKSIGYFPRETNTVGANDWEREGMKVAAGAVYFDSSAYDYALQLSNVLSQLPFRWFNDQIALSQVLSNVDAEYFDNEFMDWEFKEGTCIWTGKGPRKYDNPTYVAKKKEYGQINMNYDHVILKPRLDIMFKRNGVVLANKMLQDPTRQYWANFATKMNGELDNSVVITAPKWFFNSSIEEFFPNSTIYVPHMEKAWWGGGLNCRYYMQTVFPWLFTIDTQGWAGGSFYKEEFNPLHSYDDDAFNKLRDYKLKGGSKFQHLQEKRNINDLDVDNFVLVPLQLPHDETIKYHSDITVPEFVKAMCEWADNGGMTVVFKGHPVNLGAMVPLQEIIEQYDNVRYVVDYHINDLIEKSLAVYVINSGTGQESMLHDRPVVTFGRCDYESVTINGNIKDLSRVWKSLLKDDFEHRKTLYRKWFHWFNKITVDTNID